MPSKTLHGEVVGAAVMDSKLLCEVIQGIKKVIWNCSGRSAALVTIDSTEWCYVLVRWRSYPDQYSLSNCRRESIWGKSLEMRWLCTSEKQYIGKLLYYKWIQYLCDMGREGSHEGKIQGTDLHSLETPSAIWGCDQIRAIPWREIRTHAHHLLQARQRRGPE